MCTPPSRPQRHGWKNIGYLPQAQQQSHLKRGARHFTRADSAVPDSCPCRLPLQSVPVPVGWGCSCPPAAGLQGQGQIPGTAADFRVRGQSTVNSDRPGGCGTPMPERDRSRLEFQKNVPFSVSGRGFDIGILTSNAGQGTSRGPIPLSLIPAPVN